MFSNVVEPRTTLPSVRYQISLASLEGNLDVSLGQILQGQILRSLLALSHFLKNFE